MSPVEDERRAKVEAALAELTDGCESIGDVARKLAEAGCKGERGNCYACPIAHWLELKLGPAADVTVDECRAAVSWLLPDSDPTQPPEFDGDAVTVDLPGLLVEFVDRFDDDATLFPELDPATAVA